MSAAVNWDDDAETELCHDDDGFVYRRKRRRQSDDEPSASASAQRDPKQDLTQWRRNNLRKLKDRYRKEIHQWEVLSNALRAMEEQATQVREENVEASGTGLVEAPESDSDGARVIDELLVKAEAQEAMINHVSNLCDIAETVCSDLEEQRNKVLIDLSVWPSSPRKLISYLCDRVKGF
ncbi:hypothetical protein QQ045_009733 [Rhodiola kirilowii]